MNLRVLIIGFLLGWCISEGSEQIRPFQIKVSDSVLIDLQSRLERTRYPDQLEGAAWNYGINVDYLKEIVTYWKDKYDWRAQERLLNAFPQFKASVDGLDIHFVQAKASPQAEKVVPLLFLHGWPGSFFEAYKIIPLLTEPKDGVAFDVIAVSLPGYGFSDAAKKPGMNDIAIGKMMTKLMTQLGYDQYIVQGGDWGALIAPFVAHFDQRHCQGIHVNLFPPHYSPNLKGFVPTLKIIWEWFTGDFAMNTSWILQDSGYSHIQGTKSDLQNDNLESRFTKDELLTNAMIYWVTGSMPSSIRLYYETVQNAVTPEWQQFMRDIYISQPYAFAEFKDPLQPKLSKGYMSHFANLVQHNNYTTGGHFVAMEEPVLLVEDVRMFYEKIQSINRSKAKEL
eukprot:TRINITY_DN8591_c0_g1_i3.p1 TRINITY_DN8591_c0_g1~~TRINITY_DN8591_c0_g1_i3.p1  ORF type:complete len:395 (+),score=95.93 TRINITY_DN8591_c0_g1_i3:65-1249(+)